MIKLSLVLIKESAKISHKLVDYTDMDQNCTFSKLYEKQAELKYSEYYQNIGFKIHMKDLLNNAK